MSDISIPGVSSRYGGTKLVEDLMKVERTKLTRMEDDKKRYVEQKDVWQSLNRRFTTLRDSARKLYSFDNPFLNRVGASSEVTALTLDATRQAIPGEYKVKVIKPATGDRFLSGNVASDFQVPAGDYTFKIGEKSLTIPFRGGKLQAFSDMVNSRSKDLLKASVIKNTSSTQVFLLESQALGSKNGVEFGPQTEKLMAQMGVLAPAKTQNQVISFETSKPESLKPGPSRFSYSSEALNLEPGAKVKIPIQPGIGDTTGLILEAEITFKRLNDDEITSLEVPQGFTPGDTGSITLEGITIQNAPLELTLPDLPPAPPPTPILDMKVLSGSDGKSLKNFPPLDDITATQTVKIPLKDYLSSLSSLELVNNNTHRSLEIGKIRISDPNVKGDYKPANPLSTAADALLEWDGIQVVRENNKIDDLIPGVTLNITAPSQETVTVTVTPDYEGIKESIITLVGQYNRTVNDILVLTSMQGNKAIIDEASYLTAEEKETAQKRLGLYQGDITLNQLKASMQRTFMEAYNTNTANTFNLLAQVGISTNATGSAGAQSDASKLRGYLEIDESKLENSLKSDLEGVKRLFGMDTNGDLVVDDGAAYKIEEYLRPYTQIGGFIAGKVTVLNSQIKSQDTKMDNYNEYLERHEADLKKKYGAMESSLGAMERLSGSIENFNKQNSGQ